MTITIAHKREKLAWKEKLEREGLKAKTIKSRVMSSRADISIQSHEGRSLEFEYRDFWSNFR